MYGVFYQQYVFQVLVEQVMLGCFLVWIEGVFVVVFYGGVGGYGVVGYVKGDIVVEQGFQGLQVDVEVLGVELEVYFGYVLEMGGVGDQYVVGLFYEDVVVDVFFVGQEFGFYYLVYGQVVEGDGVVGGDVVVGFVVQCQIEVFGIGFGDWWLVFYGEVVFFFVVVVGQQFDVGVG